MAQRPNRPAMGIPLAWRAALIALAIVSGVVAFTAKDPNPASGFFRTETVYAGTAGPDGASHRLEVALPASFEGDGLRLTADRATLTLRPAGPGDAVRAVLEDGDGRAIFDAVLDPSDPLTWVHGPTVTQIGPGAFTLRVMPVDTEPASYDLAVGVAFPFTADVEGVAVSRLSLLIPLVASLALGLFPSAAWARHRLLSEPSPAPAQPEVTPR